MAMNTVKLYSLLCFLFFSFLNIAQTSVSNPGFEMKGIKDSLMAPQGPNLPGTTNPFPFIPIWSPYSTPNYPLYPNQLENCKTYTCFQCSWGGEFKVVIPNIFSPNGDGINDVWMPKITNLYCLSDYSLIIFDRWGLKVFESSVYSVGWNGNNTNGNPYDEGTYYYLMTYSSELLSLIKTEKGFFQLAR
jgi:gliding motility-associated-like protein